MSLPVTRPSGRALLVGNPASRPQVLEALQRLGYGCGNAEDPYAAMSELCRRPLVYRAMILSLASLYREELPIIRTVKRRYPHVEVWLTHTDGRQAALADAMRLGADGLLDDDGLHRVALSGSAVDETAGQRKPAAFLPDPPDTELPPTEQHPGEADVEEADASDEPILTAEELRALLQEQPSMPPAGEEET